MRKYSTWLDAHDICWCLFNDFDYFFSVCETFPNSCRVPKQYSQRCWVLPQLYPNLVLKDLRFWFHFSSQLKNNENDSHNMFVILFMQVRTHLLNWKLLNHQVILIKIFLNKNHHIIAKLNIFIWTQTWGLLFSDGCESLILLITLSFAASGWGF